MASEWDKKIDKWAVEVQLELDDGTRMLGSLFIIPHQQRMSDLLSDDRQFLPFRSSNGLTYMLRKSRIASVMEVEQAKMDAGTTADPFDILGVSPGISDDDLKNTYHTLVGEAHPDRIRSMDLPRDMVATAHTRTVRIIDAYERIVKRRQETAGVNGHNGANGHDAGAD